MKKPLKHSSAPTPPEVRRDVPGPPHGGDKVAGMVRTQIYLTRVEQGFIAAKAARRGERMAAVIRGYLDDNMRLLHLAEITDADQRQAIALLRQHEEKSCSAFPFCSW